MRSSEDSKSKEFFRLHAEVCRCVAHAKRLEILHWLREGERSVSELSELMGISPTNVSQQLSIMRGAGVLGSRRQGAKVFYRIINLKILKAYDLMTEVLEEKISAGLDALGNREKN